MTPKHKTPATERRPRIVGKPKPKEAIPSGMYFEGIGRRKVAIARVRLSAGAGKAAVINGEELPFERYFPFFRWQEAALAPLRKLKLDTVFDVSVKVSGGGISAQAEAVSLGIARALVVADKNLKKQLRAYGYLTRDARMVERKKYGLKKARRAPQWSKR